MHSSRKSPVRVRRQVHVQLGPKAPLRPCICHLTLIGHSRVRIFFSMYGRVIMPVCPTLPLAIASFFFKRLCCTKAWNCMMPGIEHASFVRECLRTGDARDAPGCGMPDGHMMTSLYPSLLIPHDDGLHTEHWLRCLGICGCA